MAFTDLTSHRVRPAVVIGQTGMDLFLVPISSQLANTDFAITAWQAAGLNVPCGIKAQIAAFEERLVVKRIGTLAPAGQKTLEARRDGGMDTNGKSSTPNQGGTF